ncbi:transposase family protein [Streptomyces mirabilis]|uniref:transposase family protein n=1 Tax=Streptomyces mirabilis TaxID=68239 RepID=UPI00331F5ADE
MGGPSVYVVTSEDSARACPGCGVFSTRLKDYRTTRPRHLSCGGRPVGIQWRKARWYCTERACPRGSFTEAIGQVPSRMRTTKALRQRRRGPRSVTAGARWYRPAGIWACPGRSCSAALRTTQRRSCPRTCPRPQRSG